MWTLISVALLCLSMAALPAAAQADDAVAAKDRYETGVRHFDLSEFEQALLGVCRDLAEDVVRNGEGVRHVIRVSIQRAA